jgi:hypothetical protein
MRKIIYNLRQQPVEVRKHVLHVSTFICGVILILIWFYTLGHGLESIDAKAKVAKDLKPLSAIQGNLIGGYQSIIDSNN